MSCRVHTEWTPGCSQCERGTVAEVERLRAEVERLRTERDALSAATTNWRLGYERLDARAQRLEAALREAKDQIRRYWDTEHRPTEEAIVQNAETIIDAALAEESKP